MRQILERADAVRSDLRALAPELAAVLRTHGATLEELLDALDHTSGRLDDVMVAWEASGALLPLANFEPARARAAAVRLLRHGRFTPSETAHGA